MNVDAIAGLTAGVMSSLALHPLDLIKVRFQVSSAVVSHAEQQAGVTQRKYSSTANAFWTIIKEEGPRGLYKGVTPALLGSGCSWGLYFFFYEKAKQRHLRNSDDPSGRLKPFHHVISALEGGSLTTLVTNPIWLIKTRMQLQQTTLVVQQSSRNYTGVAHAIRSIVKEEGVLGLYRGLIPALLLTSHGAVQFGVYEELKTACSAFGVEANSAHYMMMGGVSKVAATVATYPYQVIKSRIQQRDAKFEGVLDCVKRTYRYEGPRGFFNGLMPNLYRVVPSSALTLVVYEKVKKILSAYSERED